MKRVPYADLLDRLRAEAGPQPEPREPLHGVTLPRRRETTERLKVRLTPEQKAFVRAAAAASHHGALDKSTVVAAALAVLEDLDIPWGAIGTRDDLLQAIRAKIRSSQ